MNMRLIPVNRPVLALLMILSAASATARSVTVRGSLDGNGVGTILGPTLQAAAGGNARASRIGQFTYTMQATVNLPSGVALGTFVLSFANGDVIYGSFSGQSAPPNPGNPSPIVETLTITGGTGRFKEASGTLTFNRLIDQSTLPGFESHTGTLTGTIGIPSN